LALRAWYEPIGAPYWRRSLAYRVARASAPSIAPTRSAAVSVTASAVHAVSSSGDNLAVPVGTTERVRSTPGVGGLSGTSATA